MNPKHFAERLGRSCLILTICGAGGLYGASEPIRTGFEAGESVSETNGYPGVAGDGWQGPWLMAPAGTPAQVTVSKESPIGKASGAFLKMVLEPDNPDLLAAAIFREMAVNDLDTTRPYRVEFDLRLDYPTEGEADMCFASASSTAGNPGTGPTCTWMIRSSRSGWLLGNGDGNGGARWINSGMSCRPEEVYHFVVTVDPAASQWKVEIKADHDRVEQDQLGFRQASADGGRFIYFGTALNDVGAKGGFSLDSLSIANP